jgi:anti-sigma factor RsiW
MTVDQKYIDLIEAEIDGRLSAAERAELARHVLVNPDARELRDEMRQLCDMLDAVQAEEPPAELHADVMSALRAQSRQPGTRLPAGGRVRAYLSSPAGLRFAAAIVGGVLVGTLAFEFAGRDPGLAPSQLVGTMAPQGATASPQRQARFDNAAVVGSVTLEGTAEAPVVRVSVVSQGGVTVIASLDGEQLRFGDLQSAGSQPVVRQAAFAQRNNRQHVAVTISVVAGDGIVETATLGFDSFQ